MDVRFLNAAHRWSSTYGVCASFRLSSTVQILKVLFSEFFDALAPRNVCPAETALVPRSKQTCPRKRLRRHVWPKTSQTAAQKPDHVAFRYPVGTLDRILEFYPRTSERQNLAGLCSVRSSDVAPVKASNLILYLTHQKHN